MQKYGSAKHNLRIPAADGNINIIEI